MMGRIFQLVENSEKEVIYFVIFINCFVFSLILCILFLFQFIYLFILFLFQFIYLFILYLVIDDPIDPFS